MGRERIRRRPPRPRERPRNRGSCPRRCRRPSNATPRRSSALKEEHAREMERQRKLAELQQQQIAVLERTTRLLAEQLKKQGTATAKVEDVQTKTEALDARSKQAARRDVDLAGATDDLREGLDSIRRGGSRLLPYTARELFLPTQTNETPLAFYGTLLGGYNRQNGQSGLWESPEFSPFLLLQLNRRFLFEVELRHLDERDQPGPGAARLVSHQQPDPQRGAVPDPDRVLQRAACPRVDQQAARHPHHVPPGRAPHVHRRRPVPGLPLSRRPADQDGILLLRRQRLPAPPEADDADDGRGPPRAHRRPRRGERQGLRHAARDVAAPAWREFRVLGLH